MKSLMCLKKVDIFCSRIIMFWIKIESHFWDSSFGFFVDRRASLEFWLVWYSSNIKSLFLSVAPISVIVKHFFPIWINLLYNRNWFSVLFKYFGSLAFTCIHDSSTCLWKVDLQSIIFLISRFLSIWNFFNNFNITFGIIYFNNFSAKSNTIYFKSKDY